MQYIVEYPEVSVAPLLQPPANGFDASGIGWHVKGISFWCKSLGIRSSNNQTKRGSRWWLPL